MKGWQWVDDDFCAPTIPGLPPRGYIGGGSFLMGIMLESTMSDVWYRLHEGQTEGPWGIEEMQRKAEAGVFGAADLISRDGTHWRAASEFPEIRLIAEAAGGAVAAPMHSLNYPAPAQDRTLVTPRVVELLRQTSLWVRIMSVIVFVGCGFLVMGGGAMILASFIAPKRGGAPFPMLLVGAIYFVLAVLYLVPGILLHRYASYAKAFARLRSEQDLESAMQAQKTFWKVVVLMTLIGTGLYLVGIVAFVVVMAIFHR